MNPATIISNAKSDGVILTPTSSGTIRATGNRSAVMRWQDFVRAHKADIIPLLNADVSSHHRWWRIHFAEGDAVELACYPDASRTEILKQYPEATQVEPCSPTMKPPSAPMTSDEEASIRAWLNRIKEDDPLVIEEVISHCVNNLSDRTFFLNEARR